MANQPQNSAYFRNMRAYLPERLSARGGMVVVSSTPFDQLSIHSVRRLNDPAVALSKRIYGAGTKLYVGEGTAAVDTGYSGNPLSLVPFRPDQSPEPWMYVTDSLRMQKVRSDGVRHSIGIEPPLGAPTVSLGPDVFQKISSFAAVGSWTNAGTAGAISSVSRLSSTISAILYDSGTTGFASVYPAAFSSGIQKGMLVLVNSGGGTQETVVVYDVYQPFPSTTISSIVYDSGSTGLCTIVPVVASVASSNRGQTGGIISPAPVSPVLPNPLAIRHPQFFARRSRPPLPIAQQPPVTPGQRAQSTLAVGLQPNALLLLNSGGGNQEYVRVLSVSVGPDGRCSFRCSTVNTHAATETISGVGSFRAFFVNNHAAAEAIADSVLQSTVTQGIGTLSLASAFNIAAASGRPVQEDDVIHVSMQFDHPEYLTEARILFDVDSATNDFAHNYFYYALRQSDIQQAVLSNQTNLLARQQAITRTVTELYQRSSPRFRYGPLVLDDSNDLGLPTSGDVRFSRGGSVGSSAQAKTGSSQWTEFTFKVSDLVRVGSDMSRGLGNVAAIRFQFSVSSSTVCQVGDLWVGGTYGPDIGTTGSPLFYRFRGRSKITGAKSLAGPPTRMPIEPHRQRVIVTGAQHPNPSCDTIDLFRWGSTLPQWTYVGSVANGANWQFTDDYSDTDLANSPLLDMDVFQPFPTIDLPRSGTCNVVGTKVTQVSGDTFNAAWYPGTQININGIYYTLYAQPPGDGTLEIVENAGTQSGVPFFINQATLLGQPLPAFWGPYSEGTAAMGFGCGDKYQPGVLFITRGNDFDAAPDTLQEEVTSASEPLLNGCMYGSTPYVWSSDRLFVLTPNLGSTVTAPTPLDPSATQLFIPYPVPGSKGLFAQWGFCVGDSMYYRSKDGIEMSNGSGSESITDEDLYLLFGHDGQPGQPVTVGTITFYPPDDTKLNNQRLSFVDGHVYFDYVDTNNTQRTMVYNTKSKIWGVDDYNPTVLIHYGDEGQGLHAMVMGASDGRAYTAGGIVDGNGLAFPCEARMPQLSELSGGYTTVYDGFLGLQGSQQSSISLVVNADGMDNSLSVPVTTSYAKSYIRSEPIKGKILAFAMVSTFPFTAFIRDGEFRIGRWGRGDQMTPVNPFSNPRRAMTPKAG